jgi:hypothetical protein
MYFCIREQIGHHTWRAGFYAFSTNTVSQHVVPGSEFLGAEKAELSYLCWLDLVWRCL